MYLSRHLFQHVYQWNRRAHIRFDGDISIELGYLKHVEEPYVQLEYTMYGVRAAVENGYLHVLKMLYTHHRKEYDICEYNSRNTMMDDAAEYGHLEMVKWMYEIDHECTVYAMINAAKNRHYRVVTYLHKLKLPDCHALAAIATAIYDGNMYVAKCLYKLCIDNCLEREIPDLREWVCHQRRRERY